MLAWTLVLTACCVGASDTLESSGVISGVVVNGSARGVVVPGTEVVLRVQDRGALVPVATTTADGEGRFRFENLPTNGDFIYLPGANLAGVHYSGRRVRLTETQPTCDQRIVVFETMSGPSPLIAERHELEVHAEPGVLRVTESMLITNRSLYTYVGAAEAAANPPVTLRLSIPSEFTKVTFDREFFGRQFQLINGSIVTQIPWTPGQRELKFTYQLPLEDRQWVLHRRLDLPSEYVRLSVSSDVTDDMACNLAESKSETGPTVFESAGTGLPADFVIEVALGGLPLPWTTIARGIALVTLMVLSVGSTLVIRQRRAKIAAAALEFQDRPPAPGAKGDSKVRQRGGWLRRAS